MDTSYLGRSKELINLVNLINSYDSDLRGRHSFFMNYGPMGKKVTIKVVRLSNNEEVYSDIVDVDDPKGKKAAIDQLSQYAVQARGSKRAVASHA